MSMASVPIWSVLTVSSAVPLSVWAGLQMYPVELSPEVRFAVHFYAFILCYVPFGLWLYFRARDPVKGLGMILGGTTLRFFGLVGYALWSFDRPDSGPGAMIYLLSIGSFLFFEVVSAALNQNFTRKKEP